ncbi:MAG: bifunctional (p)ppGpp synthetase/guanosine-3',5'-bis(diphosphate) 3'-pyrophosphohydrolase, partial [Treponemataceae bacterium]|nr:bifunctional (p)ppGpp synthetase/guanosine-3',5'-bis(diphosphate) 3'-pyrophosphohydrolase [Treponemataceae bacterium]
SKARQKIHAWLVANDPNFLDKEAEAKRAAEIAAFNEHARAVQDEKRKRRRAASDAAKNRAAAHTPDGAYSGKIQIGDTTNFLVNFAGCCSPVPPQPIVGYVSNSRGIIVHRADCLTFHRIPNIERRTIAVAWEEKH